MIRNRKSKWNRIGVDILRNSAKINRDPFPHNLECIWTRVIRFITSESFRNEVTHRRVIKILPTDFCRNVVEYAGTDMCVHVSKVTNILHPIENDKSDTSYLHLWSHFSAAPSRTYTPLRPINTHALQNLYAYLRCTSIICWMRAWCGSAAAICTRHNFIGAASITLLLSLVEFHIWKYYNDKCTSNIFVSLRKIVIYFVFFFWFLLFCLFSKFKLSL